MVTSAAFLVSGAWRGAKWNIVMLAPAASFSYSASPALTRSAVVYQQFSSR